MNTNLSCCNKITLFVIDIDFFKKVNDTYGHTEGDIVLRELGKILHFYINISLYNLYLVSINILQKNNQLDIS
jgi:diguanylate cyclase (GGDEF) domain